MIRYGAEICRDLNRALQREWLETNGIGGFASSTIAGLNTRRYHGLLTAALRPPSDRYVLLSKLEETLVIDGRRYDLSCNRYPGAIYPQGHLFLHEFRLDPFPTFVWRIEDVELTKSVFMIQGENGIVARYRLGVHSNTGCRLELRPLVAFRDFHSTTHANPVLNRALDEAAGRVTVRPYTDLPALHFAHNASEVNRESDWYRNFQYDREEERGLDFEEDLFQPFTLVFDLKTPANLIASTEVRDASDAESEMERRCAGSNPYIVAREGGKSVIAGYHWFGDWGRDTMIALPGLTLATGKPEIAQDILLAFSQTISEGILPNRFPDHGEQPEYNTVDATLWYFEAIRAWLEYTGDAAFVATNLLPGMREIIERHRTGTRFGIRVDCDGLLQAGSNGAALTWMDARVDCVPVTPRHGKPVEIQALWYNALRIMQAITGEAEFGAMADKAKASFNRQFWNESAGCLFDVVSSTGKDASIRPNQLLALSLQHRILDNWTRAESVLDVVQRDLLTPYGLRTLSPRDPRYTPHYTGNPASRDRAYHQGTVWPWLLGPYCDASSHFRSVFDPKGAIAALERFRDDRGTGQIPEIFDGDAPHEPRGCIAQAWSAAEILRIKLRYGVT